MAEDKKTKTKAIKAEHRVSSNGVDYNRTLYGIRVKNDDDFEYLMMILTSNFKVMLGFQMGGDQVFVMEKIEQAKVQSALSKPEK